jgi:hypothetical protein
MASNLPRLVAVSGPLQDQILKVDENGVRPSEDCVVRLCDGRVVAYSLRDGRESPWCLLDHNARIEAGSSEFRLEHPEFDPEVVLGMFEVSDEEIESFFLGLLMEKIERPVAAAVLLDDWNPGETASATFLPGFFYPRYGIVNETRRQRAPGVYDETEHVFCARLSDENRYVGALYVKSLTPAPFRPEERVEITRIAGYLAIYLENRETWLGDMEINPEREEEQEGTEEEEKVTHRISRPAELEVVFEEPAPAYRFGQKEEQPSVEQVLSMLENILGKMLFEISHNIDAAVAAAVCLEIPGRPLHFIRLERGDDFEIDKDVVYRAFVLDVDAARNADESAWAVPIIQRERRLDVVYVEIDKDIEMDSDVIVELRGIAEVSNDPDFPENLNRFF